MASTAEPKIHELMKDLNLDPVGGNLFIGHINRVPFRMELVATTETTGLLFQTPFSSSKTQLPENIPAPAGSELEALITEKKADLSSEGKKVWFNLFAAHDLLESGKLTGVMREFASALGPYLDFDDQVCFACKGSKATLPIYHTDNLHLVCDGCHDRLNQKVAALNTIDPANVIIASMWAIVVALIGGLIWAMGWVLFEKLFGGKTLPIIVLSCAYAGLGIVIAWPISRVFKKIPRRGFKLAQWMTIGTCLLAAIFGEAFFSGYIWIRIFGFAPSSRALLEVWKIVIGESGGLYLIGRIICLLILCAIALNWSKPKTSLEEEVWGKLRSKIK